MTIRARELRAQGVDIIQLTIGEPNFASPPHAIEAAHEAALRGDTKYPPQDGTPALKQAIQRKFKRDNGLDFALDEICVTNGGKQAIFNALMATVNPGDEVGDPGAVVERLCADDEAVRRRAGVRQLPAEQRLQAARRGHRRGDHAEDQVADPEQPEQSDRRLLLGRRTARDRRRDAEASACLDHVGRHVRASGVRRISSTRRSPQVAPELRDRTLTISGASKTYAMTGWRIGFAGGPKNLIRAMVNMQGQATAGVSTVGQAAAAAALDGPQDGVAEQIVAYRNRRDMAVEMLNACRGINCHKPEGAFYVFPNVAGCIGKTTAGGRKLATDQDVCMALLEEAHVATVHGAAYGMSPYLRVSTATDDDVARRGLPAHRDVLRRACTERTPSPVAGRVGVRGDTAMTRVRDPSPRPPPARGGGVWARPSALGAIPTQTGSSR